MISSWLPSMVRTVCQNEVGISGWKRLKAADPVLMIQEGIDAHPHPQMKKKHGVFSSNYSWKL
jgi:hypothetical protein